MVISPGKQNTADTLPEEEEGGREKKVFPDTRRHPAVGVPASATSRRQTRRQGAIQQPQRLQRISMSRGQRVGADKLREMFKNHRETPFSFDVSIKPQLF